MFTNYTIPGRDLKVYLQKTDTDLEYLQVLASFIINTADEDKVLFYVSENGYFYFMAAHDFDMERFAENPGYAIDGYARYNARYMIGVEILRGRCSSSPKRVRTNLTCLNCIVAH